LALEERVLSGASQGRTREENIQTWFAFEAYTLRIEQTMPALLPQLRILRTGDGRVVLQRGTATAYIDRGTDGVSVLLVQRNAVVLRTATELTATSSYELIADLVGFFCGASLSTLWLYPHRDPKPVVPRPRRHWNRRY
jgi:hypothetical protein